MTPNDDAPKPVSERRSLVEAVVASTVGTTIEWYDFFLYITAAALVFPRLFFPESDPSVGLIFSFGTSFAGFLARPLGAAVFGYMGDRVGRKATLITTLLMMGISTMLIGGLPTHEQIGPAAVVLLVALRFLQGLAVGGEWGGAVLLAVEYGHRRRRGFLGSWPQTGVPLGLLLSSAVMGVMQRSLPEADFLSWGWRVPFLLSGVMIVVGLAIRVRILETPLFRQLQESNQVAQSPIRETLRHHWREVLLAAGARLSENTCFYLFTGFVIAYAHERLKLDKGFILDAISLAAAVEFVATPLFGHLSDRWSRKGMFITGLLIQIAFAFPYFALLETRQEGWVLFAVVFSLVGAHAMLFSVVGSFFPELFGTRVRYTGASLGYQLTGLGGGLAPMLAAWLMRDFPNQSWPIALYIVLVASVSLACVCYLAETSRKNLTADIGPGSSPRPVDSPAPGGSNSGKPEVTP